VLTGDRLKALNINFNNISISTMVRAQETASIISDKFPGVPQEDCGMLREGSPCVPVYREWAPDEDVRFCVIKL